MTGHLLPLGDTGWLMWREVLLRSAGFPVDGLDLLSTPDAATAVDAALRGEPSEAGVDLDQALAEATAATARAASLLAADPMLREAVTWQNRRVLPTFDHLAREGPAARYNTDRRQREEVLARYWQRYCAKNETIGFFGPVCWGELDPAVSGVRAEPGPGLVRRRRVFLEHWALRAIAEAAAADPAVRATFPPRLQPQLTVEGREVIGPAGQVTELSPVEAAVVACCDGRASAAEVVAAAAARPESMLRSPADGYLQLQRLVDRGVLLWDANLPVTLEAEAVLRSRLPGAARAGLDRICELRDEVERAAGNPDRLLKALTALDAAFVEQTGFAAHRNAGEAYGGRTLCHEETSRDLDLVLGTDVLAPLASPLAPLLAAARWLTVELARAYRGALRQLHDELADAGGEVRLCDLWFLAQGLLFGEGERPADAVAAEFTARWTRLFGLDALPAGVHELRLPAAELAERVAELFPAAAPGWSAARLHSPDLHLCAASPEAIRDGDFFWVLGELHAAWATFDAAVFTVMHPEPARLVAALSADIGEERLRPLLPVDWPRHSGRLSTGLDSAGVRQLGIAAAPGADPDRLLPSSALRVRAREDGELVAVAPDGRRWPLLEVFSSLLSVHAVDAFKLVASRPYTPRITVDRLVVCRRTWRTSTAALAGLRSAKGLDGRFVQARRWRLDAGLPERAFVRVGSETKPVYLDFTSPLLVSALCVTLRSAHNRFGDTPVVLTELLPGPEHAWVRDAAGRRYTSELRIQAVDPSPSSLALTSPPWGTSMRV